MQETPNISPESVDEAAIGAGEEEIALPLKQDNVRQLKIAMGTLAASVVETLNESDNTFQERFLSKLERAYETYRNNSDADPQHVLDVIHWTAELLRGWNPVPGRDEPIFGAKPASPDPND